MKQIGIMGDPHGHIDETIKLLFRMHFIDQNEQWIGENRQLICVGDYVDRGPNGIETINFFMKLQKQAGSDNVLCLLGNHDVLILAAHYFGDHPSGGPGGTFYEEYIMNGGNPDELRNLTPAHIEWLSQLPAMLSIDNILITHADSLLYKDYGKSVDEVNGHFGELLHSKDPADWDLLLERFSDRLAFYNDPHLVEGFLDQFGGKTLVHGHTPLLYMGIEETIAPYHYANGKCINVDACAYKGNPLIMYLSHHGDSSSK